MPTDTKRTKGIYIYTPIGQDYRLEVMRELIRTYENGDALPLPSGERRVRRVFSLLASQPLPDGPVTLSTYADLANLLSVCGSALAGEDEQLEAELAAEQNTP